MSRHELYSEILTSFIGNLSETNDAFSGKRNHHTELGLGVATHFHFKKSGVPCEFLVLLDLSQSQAQDQCVTPQKEACNISLFDLKMMILS